MAIRAGRPRPARDRAESLSVRGHARPQRQRAERYGARPAGTFEKERDLTELALPAFWIDTTEVTNRQFKAFVDAGGYGNRSYWREPFLTHGRSLTWEEAMARFRDTTGRPGPATWELGAFADGQADLPVAGVSWYEAAAYAAWAGKSLPTIYHWSRVSGAFGIFSDILQYSNFNGRGPVAVGTSGSLGPFGTHDLAGNVKEWIWNEGGTGQRFILGGAWNEPPYQFHDEDASRSLRAATRVRLPLHQAGRAPRREPDRGGDDAGPRPLDAEAGQRRSVPGPSRAL